MVFRERQNCRDSKKVSVFQGFWVERDEKAEHRIFRAIPCLIP